MPRYRNIEIQPDGGESDYQDDEIYMDEEDMI
ncbi:hypothetical protein SDC9_128995 [bioreactor metagenome]